ncbi:MAG: DUF721 domain-containing protein [Deltaproteobacteria bacterium]|nr:DUF721 domain-containing protein [Deltaproteobacteria bacterium]MBW2209622.1 DUF721 domain-containing protein [Deltaproteobacteria bacterium]MBW2214422.1 DUF721 domain-containing protein [Deltaproteobacteria bacterium]MBW2379270.1 DUF721 domain-containing protein [Deltaproteobacteria bacterium]MBW2550724.1 DUF721 domain-containing protein [Deltaproteobacteria bacterium]
MAKRKKGKLESVAKLLKGVYPAPDQLEAAKVFTWWSRSVPPRILEHARPVRLSRGVLIVHVSSSVWANELHYLTDDLLTRLREDAPTAPIEKIRFQVGPLPDIPKRARETPPPPEPVRLASLPEELGRALSRVEDDDLRKAITEAATTSLARTREPKE